MKYRAEAFEAGQRRVANRLVLLDHHGAWVGKHSLDRGQDDVPGCFVADAVTAFRSTIEPFNPSAEAAMPNSIHQSCGE